MKTILIFSILQKQMFLVFFRPTSGLLGSYLIANLLIAFLLILFLKKTKNEASSLCFLGILNALFFLVSFGTETYDRIFQQTLNFHLLKILDHLGDANSSLAELIGKRDILYFPFDFAILVALPFRKLRFILSTIDKCVFSIDSNKIKAIIVALMVFWIPLTSPGNSIIEPFGRTGWKGILTFSPVFYYSLEALKCINKEYFYPPPSDALKSEIIKSLRIYKSPPLKPPYKLNIEKPNFIVIECESYMSWAMNAKFNGKEVTPFFNSLASQSLFIPNFYSQSLQSSDSTFSFMTSLYPHENYYAHVEYFTNEFQSFPKVLKRNGYKTYYSEATRATFFNNLAMNRSFGFDKATYLAQFKQVDKLGWGLSDKSFFSQVLPIIATLPQPFYAHLHTVSTHHPFTYSAVPSYFKLEDLPWKDERTLGYLNCLHYSDEALRIFFENIKNSEFYSNCVFLLFGDHGFRLDPIFTPVEENYVKYPMNRNIATILLANTPCIIFIPEVTNGEINSKYCGQIDLSPTLLNIASISSPLEFLGKSIFEKAQGQSINKLYTGISKNNIFLGKNERMDDFSLIIDRFQGTPHTNFNTKECFKKLELSKKMLENNLCTVEKLGL